MKCPKCGYLGFDRADRCRNCGYEFALSREVAIPELPLHRERDTEAFPDLSLGPENAPDRDVDLDADLDRAVTTPLASRVPPAAVPAAAQRGVNPAAPVRPPAPVAPPAAVAPSAPAADLPLFGGPITDDVPLITKASPPRTPLSVRRSTPEVARLRSDVPRAQSLELDLEIPPPDTLPVDPASRSRGASWTTASLDDAVDAGVGLRIVAAAIDFVVLTLVDVVVVYFTMQICGLTRADLGILPKGPLLAFLAVQNGGYLVAFTAGGQTLGKMAAGIKVVSDASASSVDLGRAMTRTLMWVVLAIPAGLGFLPALFSRDHRGLHDRLAGTRVVRASA